MADRLDIAKLKLEKGLLSGKGAPSTAVADGLQGLFSGIDADVQAKRETRQAFKEESASDIRDLRSLRAEAQAAGATDDKSSSGQSIKLGDIPTSTTLANWTLTQLDGFIQDSYNQQEIVTSGLGGSFAVRDYGIFKNNQKQTWQAVKGRADAAAAELEQTKKNAQGYTNDEGVFVPPTAGAGEAAFQRYQSIIGDLNNTRIISGEDGMGVVEVYQTVYDPASGVQKRVLDKDGNPIINKNISGTSVMSLMNGENSRWQRTDVIGAVDKAFSKDVIAAYDVSINHPGYLKGSSREDNIRRNPSFTRYQDTFIEKTLPNNRAVSSTLTDNYSSEFYQLDPDQTASGVVDGVKINMTDTITVQVLTGYDSNGKPIYEDKSAPKYIGSKVEGDGIVVQTTDAHKAAASGIVRGAVDGKIGKGIKSGVAVAQFDPYRKSVTDKNDKLDSGVDLFKQVQLLHGGTDAEVKAATETLMVKSGFKFSDTSVNEKVNDRGEKVVMSQTYQVDKGDGMKSFELSLMTDNPKYDKDKQAKLKKGDKGYEPQFIPVSKQEFEDKYYELFKGKGDQPSVSKSRNAFAGKNKNYSPAGKLNTDADRSMSVTTTEDVDVAEIPVITLSSAVSKGGPTLLDDIKSSASFKNLADNTFNDTEAEFKALAVTLQSKFNSMSALQGANQGGDIEITSNGENIIVKKGGVEILSEGNDDLGNEGLVEAVMNAALKSLPGKAAGTRKRTTKGGVEVDEFGVPIE
tara:strand:+ start:1380 stop:3611 length:2232 start_codon:yes stop_codon:yes gene_type:complete